ncbi:hypothetical protein D9M70_489600 [compost metagenome]
MSRQNGFRLAGDCLLDFRRVDIQRIRAYVHHDRAAALPDNAGSRRDIAERRGDDFTFQIQRPDRDLDRDGPIAQEQQMVDIKVILELDLQLVQQWTIVG